MKGIQAASRKLGQGLLQNSDQGPRRDLQNFPAFGSKLQLNHTAVLADAQPLDEREFLEAPQHIACGRQVDPQLPREIAHFDPGRAGDFRHCPKLRATQATFLLNPLVVPLDRAQQHPKLFQYLEPPLVDDFRLHALFADAGIGCRGSFHFAALPWVRRQTRQSRFGFARTGIIGQSRRRRLQAASDDANKYAFSSIARNHSLKYDPFSPGWTSRARGYLLRIKVSVQLPVLEEEEKQEEKKETARNQAEPRE
ncbi:MAG TPA: hypothetical protein VMV87_20075 [Burkholderiales bacterium]|nr:hypothetical protein [Burkholderiales bacterium]